MKKGVVVYLLLGLFLLIVIYILIVLSRGNTNFFGRASGAGVFNPTNSYVFASPLSARVNGDKIRITVFALDGQGKGIANKSVNVDCQEASLCQAGGASFTEVQGMTDSLGQAIYDLSLRAPGKYILQATVGGVPIPQTVTVSFQ